jgi:hypothetical protein
MGIIAEKTVYKVVNTNRENMSHRVTRRALSGGAGKSSATKRQ